jgi:hypothetical protein
VDRINPAGISLLLLVLAAPASTQESGLGSAFPPGERLVFEGKFGLIRLGQASMEVLADDTVRGEPARRFALSISASLIGVYHLDDRFESWVSRRTHRSLRFVQDYDESNQQRRNEYEILPDSGYYRQSGINSLFRTVADPLDETALLYWVRTLDLAPGDTIVVDRYFRPERNPITITVLERDTVDVPAGRFATVVLHPEVPDGGLLFSPEAEARIWISDDERRLVVQMKVQLMSHVTITLRLQELAGADPAPPPSPPPSPDGRVEVRRTAHDGQRD